MTINDHDQSILRPLAEQWAGIAALPVHKEKAELWRQCNDLEKARPMVWITEIPWHEFDDPFLTFRCEDEFCRWVEQFFRRNLYQWNHFPADMILEPCFYMPLVIHDSDFGIQTDEQTIEQHAGGRGIHAHEYHPVITEEKDVAKIRDPVLELDRKATDARYEALTDCFGDILPVKPCGICTIWFSPWDELITWTGVEEGLINLALKPDLIHAAMDRLVNAHLARLAQWEQLNVLCVREANYRVGSGGFAYTKDLPAADFNPDRVRPVDQWGCAAPQIFSEVSPAMHEEFALQYERRWLEKFGLAYYGCCEPLHHKIDMLKNVKNLRKISMNYKVNVDTAVRNVADRYVFSYKPNPASVAVDNWNPEAVRQDIKTVLDKAQDCIVEIILKDISTIRQDPRRLEEWERIVMDLVT